MKLLGLAAIPCAIFLPLCAQDRPSDFPKTFAGHAEFETTSGFREAGWASLVKAPGGSQAYILSVRHLLGLEGGFPRQVTAADVPSFVRSIKIDAFSGGVRDYIVNGLPISSPDNDPLQRPLDDIALFQLHNGSPLERAVVLSDHAPVVGEAVWLMTKTEKTDGIMVEATVISSRPDKWLTVQLKAGMLEKQTSGAPVLNGAGELVGVYSHREAKTPSILDLIPSTTVLKVLSALHSP